MTYFRFNVIEYDAWGAPAKKVISESEFVISEKRLIVAAVLAMLSNNASWKVRGYLAAAMVSAIRVFVDEHKAPHFSVSIDTESLRDFSLTSRVGEIAQGVVYAYWTYSLNARLADFVEWSTATYPKHTLSSKPDYIAHPATARLLQVLEGKGTLGTHPTERMRKALAQAKQNLAHPGGIGQAFGAVVTFDHKKSCRATLHIQDPPQGRRATEETRWEVFKRSYAAWYELAGDVRMAAYCRGYDRGILDNEQGASPQVRTVLLAALGYREARFDVDSRISEAIQSHDAYMEGRWREVATQWMERRLIDPYTDFPDGTTIAAVDV